MTLEELMRSCDSELERKKILIAYYKGWNEGVRLATQLITDSEAKISKEVQDE
jgi:hypothetical protein